MAPPHHVAHIGRVICRYRLTRVLGEGGMGTVFEAEHEQLGRRAAVKILLPHYCVQADLLRRFFDEARAANLVEHPSLVQIFESGRLDDGTAFLIMEFLRGQSLRSRLERGSLQPSSIACLGAQVAEALAAAHARGIVHRDLKPENIMLVFDPVAPGRERAKILDFGIAKLLGDGPMRPRTDSGLLMGTPMYMSPEQCRGAGQVSFPSDVYSLGILLYEMVVGRPPFVGEGSGEIMFQHISDAVPALPRGPGTDEDLAQLIERMLDKDPTRRPTMAAVATLLEHLAPSSYQREGVTARRLRRLFAQATVLLRGRRRERAGRGPVAHALIAVSLAGLLIGGFSHWRSGKLTNTASSKRLTTTAAVASGVPGAAARAADDARSTTDGVPAEAIKKPPESLANAEAAVPTDRTEPVARQDGHRPKNALRVTLPSGPRPATQRPPARPTEPTKLTKPRAVFDVP